MKNQVSKCCGSNKFEMNKEFFCENCHSLFVPSLPEKCQSTEEAGVICEDCFKGTWEERWDDHWQDNAPDYVKIKDFLHQEINKAYQEGSAKKGEHGRKMYEQGYKESKTQIIQEIIKISEGMKNTTEMKEIEGIKYTTGFKKALSDLKESLQELNKKQ